MSGRGISWQSAPFIAGARVRRKSDAVEGVVTRLIPGRDWSDYDGPDGYQCFPKQHERSVISIEGNEVIEADVDTAADWETLPTAWIIYINGYGCFLFDGTDTEAQEMRAHKARWERGIGLLRPATLEEAAGGSIDSCINHPLFPHISEKKRPYAGCKCERCVS